VKQIVQESFFVLGIDTSGEYCGAGLVNNERVLGEISERAPQEHSSRLIPFIDKILKDNGIEIQDINGIAVSIGPGCFTGLRVGVATAKALAQTLNVPIVGVPTLDIIALNVIQRFSLIPFHNKPEDVKEFNICTVVDAKKQQIYTSLYRLKIKGQSLQLKKTRKGSAITVNELPVTFGSGQMKYGYTIFVGNAIRTYGEKIRERFERKAILAPEEMWYPRAANIALEGYRRLLKNKKGENLFRLKPVYIREPDIRKSRKIELTLFKRGNDALRYGEEGN